MHATTLFKTNVKQQTGGQQITANYKHIKLFRQRMQKCSVPKPAAQQQSTKCQLIHQPKWLLSNLSDRLHYDRRRLTFLPFIF